MRRMELTGKVFGGLHVLAFAGVSKDNHSLWECQCACGNVAIMRGANLVHHGVKQCVKCNRTGKYLPTQWKGHGDISGAYLYQLRYHADGRSLAFEVTPELLWQLYLDQQRLCALSGVPIKFARQIFDGKKDQTASLDRKDASLGYIPSNVWWVHKALNLMKMRCSPDEFIEWCNLVAAHNQRNEPINARQ